MSARLRGDAGQVAGAEAVPFGLLVLLVGTLLVAHTWAVVDAKFVTTEAAREGTRAYVEAPSAGAGEQAAHRAAEHTMAGAGRRLDGIEIRPHGGFGRCAPVTAEVTTAVPSVGVPWRGRRPVTSVRARHTEVVDPYRDGLPGRATCAAPR